MSSRSTLLGRWSAAAYLMTRGELIGPTEISPETPPADTGEALGIGPQQLTVTVGFGTSFFDERFGLATDVPPPWRHFLICRATP